VLHTQKHGFEPRFVPGDAGTVSQIRSQSVLPQHLSAFRNRFRACPPGSIKPIKESRIHQLEMQHE
jgi:hypothetical protein